MSNAYLGDAIQAIAEFTESVASAVVARDPEKPARLQVPG